MAKGNKADNKGGKKAKKKKKDDGYVAYKRETAPSLKAKYRSEIKDALKSEFGYENVMQIPRVTKVSLNMGLGRAVANPKLIESAVDELRSISGQAPVVCAAKRDIATFKLRKGHKIGTSVTLRGDYMWEFLDRLINIALPQVRDFRGVSPKAFDGRGNYSLGIKEQIIFPEINYDEVDEVKGMNVTIVTTAQTDAEARALLKHLGMPFRVPSSEAKAA